MSKTERDAVEDDDEDDDEDSRTLIMSLLNSRQNKQAAPNQGSTLSTANKATTKELTLIDLKRQFIQGQLEAVRKQKEKLQIQTMQASQQQPQLQSAQRAFSHSILAPNQVYHMPPPVKVHKLMPNTNLHELSTIKEVDTPKSERNLKINNKNVNNILF